MNSYNIFDAKDRKVTYLNPVNKVDRKTSPFKEIINHEDYSKYSVSAGETEKISLENAFQLQINVTEVGIFHVLFDSQYFSKDAIVPEISNLKSINVNSNRTAIDKVNTLINIVKPHNPIMVIYDPIGPYAIDELYVAMIGKGQVIFMLPEGEGVFPAPKVETRPVKEEPQKINKPKPVTIKKEKTSNGKNDWFKIALAALKTFFAPIIQDKFHFIFALLASFIIGFTSGIGVYNAVLGKGIAVFFFICCAAGFVLNAFVYSDLYKTSSVKSLKFLLSTLVSLFGIGIAIAGSAIFYSLQNNLPEDFPGFGSSYAIFVPLAFALVAISMFISIPVKKLLKK